MYPLKLDALLEYYNFPYSRSHMYGTELMISWPFSCLEARNAEQKKKKQKKRKSENRILIGQRLVSWAGVFLMYQRKSEGSVFPGFLQLPVQTGIWFGATCCIHSQCHCFTGHWSLETCSHWQSSPPHQWREVTSAVAQPCTYGQRH